MGMCHCLMVGRGSRPCQHAKQLLEHDLDHALLEEEIMWRLCLIFGKSFIYLHHFKL